MRPSRTLVAALALVTAASIGALGTTPPAQAAPPGVTAADLPTVDQVAELFPYLEGGSRDVVRARHLDVARTGCFQQDNGIRVASARWAFYPTADGDTAYFQGEEDPTWFVFQFATVAKARAAFDAVSSYVERCAGRSLTRDQITKRVRGVALPPLGHREVGYRTRTVEGGDVDSDLEVYVLRGRRIERSWIQLDEGLPSKAHAVAMARLVASV